MGATARPGLAWSPHPSWERRRLARHGRTGGAGAVSLLRAPLGPAGTAQPRGTPPAGPGAPGSRTVSLSPPGPAPGGRLGVRGASPAPCNPRGGAGRARLRRVTPGEGWPTPPAAPGSLGPSRSLRPARGRSGCCCGHVAAVPRSGAREALRNLLLLHRGGADVAGRPLRAPSAALGSSPSLGHLPRWVLARRGWGWHGHRLVTNATCSRLTPEPAGGNVLG